MKRYLALGLVALVAVAVGCSDDEDLFTAGNPDDPDYQGFTEEFVQVDELTGDMANMSFEAIDVFTAPTGVMTTADVSVEDFTWNEETSTWEGDWTRSNVDRGIEFTVQGTVQFWEGSSAVQYPSDNVTQVVTTVSADGVGEDFVSESAQNLTVTRAVGSDFMTLNGAGSMDITYTHSRTDEAGTTTCAGETHFTNAIHDVVIPDNDQGADQCPVSGVVSYTGSIDVDCTGAHPWAHAGQWSVASTFGDEGTVTHRFTRGRRVWTATGSCD